MLAFFTWSIFLSQGIILVSLNLQLVANYEVWKWDQAGNIRIKSFAFTTNVTDIWFQPFLCCLRSLYHISMSLKAIQVLETEISRFPYWHKCCWSVVVFYYYWQSLWYQLLLQILYLLPTFLSGLGQHVLVIHYGLSCSWAIHLSCGTV